MCCSDVELCAFRYGCGHSGSVRGPVGLFRAGRYGVPLGAVDSSTLLTSTVVPGANPGVTCREGVVPPRSAQHHLWQGSGRPFRFRAAATTIARTAPSTRRCGAVLWVLFKRVACLPVSNVPHHLCGIVKRSLVSQAGALMGVWHENR